MTTAALDQAIDEAIENLASDAESAPHCPFCGARGCTLARCAEKAAGGCRGDAAPDCARCRRTAEGDGFGPPHNGSTACRNHGANRSIAAGGKTEHCTCDGCF